MNKERLVAYLDAVLAIIATIMVLEFKVPDQPTWHGLAELTQPVIAYALSFFIMAVTWYTHHQLFKHLKNVTYKIFWYNMLTLFGLSFFPFATAWIGKDFMAFVPEFVYFIVGLVNFAIYHLLLEREVLKHLPEDVEHEFAGSRTLSAVRIITILIACCTIWVFPPAALISLLIFTVLHITEHLHLWHKRD